MRPTPEQWWPSLDEVDRQAYMEAVKSGGLTQEFVDKMADARVPVQRWGFIGNPLESDVPREFLRFITQKIAQAEQAEG